MAEFRVGDDNLDVVDNFCYLGDTICAGGGCDRAIVTRIRCAWGKFRELLPLLTSKSISLPRRGFLFSACVRSVMLHASECWAARKTDIARLCRADRSMIRWICNVRLADRVSSQSLLGVLNLAPIESLARGNRLRWHGHVERSSGWIKDVSTMHVEGSLSRGRPKLTWHETVKNDMVLWGMNHQDPQNRCAWRARIRAKMKPVEPAVQWNQRR